MRQKQQYIKERFDEHFKAMLIKTCFWGSGIYFLALVQDMINPPKSLPYVFATNIAVIVFVLWVGYAVRRRYWARGIAFHTAVLFVITAVLSFQIQYRIMLSGGVRSDFFFEVILLGIASVGFLPVRLNVALALAVMSIAIYTAPLLLAGEAPPLVMFRVSNLAVAYSLILVLRLQHNQTIEAELDGRYELELHRESLSKTVQERTSELMRQELEYATVADNTHVAIVKSNLDGKIVYANQTFAKMMAYESQDDILSLSVADFYSDPARRSELLAMLASDGKIEDFEIEVLDAHRKPRTILFNGVLRGGIVTGLIVDLSELKQTEKRLRTLLAEKEVLLMEVHHRVKNNMQIISSLLSLQVPYIKDPLAMEQFTETRSRIKSMALAHDRFYSADNLSLVPVQPYVEALARMKSTLFGGRTIKFHVDVDARGVSLEPDSLIPCGLILNELFSNAIKHACSDTDEVNIALSVRRAEDGTVTLFYRDDGPGLPEGFSVQEPGGLGMKLVDVLVAQLGGSIEAATDCGAIFTIRFPPQEPSTLSAAF